MSTLHFAVDDPTAEKSKQFNLDDIIVELFNGGRTASMRKGVTAAESVPLLAINHSLRQDERYMNQYQ